MNQTLCRVARPNRLRQRPHHQISRHSLPKAAPDDLTGEQVFDRRQIKPSFRGRHIVMSEVQTSLGRIAVKDCPGKLGAPGNLWLESVVVTRNRFCFRTHRKPGSRRTLSTALRVTMKPSAASLRCQRSAP